MLENLVEVFSIGNTARLNISLRGVLIIFHIIAAVISAGAATASDLLFFRSIVDGKITKTELQFLKTVTLLIWGGLALAVFTGGGLVLLTQDMSAAHHFPRIFSKVVIAIVITVNGMFLHLKVLPLFTKYMDKPLVSREFIKNVPLIFTSGAVSSVSWYSILILGAWRDLEVSIIHIFSVYAVVLILAAITANILGLILVKNFKRKYPENGTN